MRSIANRSSVVGCQRDIIEPDIDLVYDVAYEPIYLFQSSDLAFEIAIMACDVGRFYVDENEVLVFASLSVLIPPLAPLTSMTSIPAAIASPWTIGVPEMQHPRRSNMDLKLGRLGIVPAPLVRTMFAAFSPSLARS